MGKNQEKIDKLITVCEEHGYNKDSAFNIVLICCSEQMQANGYSSALALEKAKEYVLKGKTSSETIYELLKLTGYKA